MRYFTPALYARTNSSDEAEAEVASQLWEAAIAEYERHLKNLPAGPQQLARLLLHDASILELASANFRHGQSIGPGERDDASICALWRGETESAGSRVPI